MKLFLTLLTTFFCVANTVSAQTIDETKQIEDYLNNLKTLSADFVQTASNGAVAEGKILMAKPNKMRMEYTSPDKILIVGNGDYIVFYDQELDQITNIDYKDIPATMILSNNIQIDGQNLKLSNFSKDEGRTEVTLEYAKASQTGPITLVFNNNPFYLKQWKIVDPQNIEITLSLYNVEQDKPLDDKNFTFKKKSMRQSGGRRR